MSAMAKRGPTSELTDRNWDNEDEPEEAGIFTKASQEVMQNRVVRKAKRRGISSDNSESKPSAFSGFGGFMALKPEAPILSEATLKKSEPLSAFGTKTSLSGGATSSLNGADSLKGESKASSAYLHSLKALNESVLAWIKQHVEKSPYILLTPIFKDYEKYLESIESKKSVSASSIPTKPPGSDSSKINFSAKPSTAMQEKSETAEKGAVLDNPKATTFAFGSTTSSDAGIKFSVSSSAGSGFVFGKTMTDSTASSKGFVFGQNAGKTTDSSGFSFAVAGSTSESTTAPVFSFGTSQDKFSFGATSGAQTSENQTDTKTGDDEEYVPPKPEVKAIQEEDAVYSKRCKLFYQKDDKWIDRGVGNLHLKPVKETNTQLLVRADTNLGNVLLNVMLSMSMPASRQGKNNVLVVCVPNPPINPKTEGTDEAKTPIPMLIRVKTGEDADELLAKLDERKALL